MSERVLPANTIDFIENIEALDSPRDPWHWYQLRPRIIGRPLVWCRNALDGPRPMLIASALYSLAGHWEWEVVRVAMPGVAGSQVLASGTAPSVEKATAKADAALIALLALEGAP